MAGKTGSATNVNLPYIDYAYPLNRHIIYVKDNKQELLALNNNSYRDNRPGAFDRYFAVAGSRLFHVAHIDAAYRESDKKGAEHFGG